MGYKSVFASDVFKGKTIIVTGGGSGIGRCNAHEIASLGGHVVLIGRKQDKLEKVTAEIEEDGGSASFHACDIRDEEAVKQTVSNIVKDHPQIYGLVNNAGGQFPAPLAVINKKGWDAVISTNLTGGFLMAREVFTQSMNRYGGSIVNIVADMWGGMPGMGHSGAARAGMTNFTQTAAVEWASCGVRVNAVAPGWIRSSGMDTYDAGMQAILKNLAAAVPLKRMGNEAEVSGTICFLLSEAAAYVSGTTVRIDGASSQGNAAVFPLPDHNKSKPFDGFHREVIPDVFKDEGAK